MADAVKGKGGPRRPPPVPEDAEEGAPPPDQARPKGNGKGKAGRTTRNRHPAGARRDMRGGRGGGYVTKG